MTPVTKGNIAAPEPPNAAANPIPLTCKCLGKKLRNKPEEELETGRDWKYQSTDCDTEPEASCSHSRGESTAMATQPCDSGTRHTQRLVTSSTAANPIYEPVVPCPPRLVSFRDEHSKLRLPVRFQNQQSQRPQLELDMVGVQQLQCMPTVQVSVGYMLKRAESGLTYGMMAP
ncbi:hypothetical protein KCV06_g81, partial [Aureobasidium melanogenum]